MSRAPIVGLNVQVPPELLRPDPVHGLPQPVRSWSVHYDAKPWGTNARLHHMARAALVKEWRSAFYYLTRQARVPMLRRARIVVLPYYRLGPQPDIGHAWESAKAAIDGVVDAGALIDDTPAHLVALELRPASRNVTAGLTLLIEEVL